MTKWVRATISKWGFTAGHVYEVVVDPDTPSYVLIISPTTPELGGWHHAKTFELEFIDAPALPLKPASPPPRRLHSTRGNSQCNGLGRHRLVLHTANGFLGLQGTPGHARTFDSAQRVYTHQMAHRAGYINRRGHR
jgi:hypothetical protein